MRESRIEEIIEVDDYFESTTFWCAHTLDDLEFDITDPEVEEVEVFCSSCGHSIACSYDEAVAIFAFKMRKFLDEWDKTPV